VWCSVGSAATSTVRWEVDEVILVEVNEKVFVYELSYSIALLLAKQMQDMYTISALFL
jgi:hypothetical protein